MSRLLRRRRGGAGFVPGRFEPIGRLWRPCPRCRGLPPTGGLAALDLPPFRHNLLPVAA